MTYSNTFSNYSFALLESLTFRVIITAGILSDKLKQSSNSFEKSWCYFPFRIFNYKYDNGGASPILRLIKC